MIHRDGPLFLIGYRGTGKTTIAQCVATRLDWAFMDADAELERRAGCTIRDIFAQQGEPAFRDLESGVLAELAECQRTVIATGGGVVLREENRIQLRKGYIIWLTASVDTLHQRIMADVTTAARRPNLTTQGGRDEIAALLSAREPRYAECANFTLDTEGASPEQLADRILSAWQCETR